MMLLQTTAPQPHPPAGPTHDAFSRILQRDWQNDLLVFVRTDLPRLLVVFLLAFVFWRLVVFFVDRMRRIADQQVGNAQRAAQLRTMASILRATAYSLIGFILLLQVLLVFGVRVEPLLASAGVVGVGIGLGAQSIFKDVLNGIFILIEDQYNVGDTVRIAGLAGVVESLSLRVTRLRDGDGTLNIIPNSQIATVQNLSRDYSVATLAISVDASAAPDHVIATLQAIANEIRADLAFKEVIVADPTVLGVNDISGRQVTYPTLIRVRANQKDGVLREMRRRVIMTFEREGIPLGTSTDLLVMQRTDPTLAAKSNALA